MKSVAIKQSSIDIDKIITNKKMFDFTEEDHKIFSDIVDKIKNHYEKNLDNKSNDNKSNDNKSNDNKSNDNKSNDNKSNDNKPFDKLNIAGMINELTETFDDSKDEKLDKVNEFNFHWPQLILSSDKDIIGLHWSNKMELPEYLKSTCNVIKQIFSNMKDSDISGMSVKLYPPSIKREYITTIDRADYGVTTRYIGCFQSDEQFTFTLSQGNYDAKIDYSIRKNNVLMLGFGSCNIVSVNFNNNGTYIYKQRPNDKGTSKHKFSKNRWILVIDFTTFKNVIDKEIKKATASVSNGDTEYQQKLENKIETFMKDTDFVAKAASNKTDILNTIVREKEKLNVEEKLNGEEKEKLKTEDQPKPKVMSRQERRAHEREEEKKLLKQKKNNTNNNNNVNNNVNNNTVKIDTVEEFSIEDEGI